MKKAIFVVTAVCMLSLIVLCGCRTNNYYEVPEYEYATIHTSKSNNISIIDTYDSDGVPIQNYEIRIGGLTGGAFMKVPVLNQGNIYITSPVLANKSHEFITQINTSDFSVDKLNSEKPPTTFAIDENFVYLGSSLPEGFYIAKVSKAENEILQSTFVDGIGNYLIVDENFVYAISKINSDDEKHIAIFLLSKEDLSIVNQIDLLDVADVQCGIVDHNVMYLSAIMKNDTNNFIELNIDTKDYSKTDVPFAETYNIHLYDENAIIVEHGGADVLVFNIITKDFTTFELENDNLCSFYKNEVLYSSDGNSIFSYDKNHFELLDKFEIQTHEDMRFISFFIE